MRKDKWEQKALEEAWLAQQVQYLGTAVNVVRVSFFTLQQRDVCDIFHWIGQSQKNLAFLERFKNCKSRSHHVKSHHLLLVPPLCD